MHIAQFAKTFGGKEIVDDLCLLQTKNIRLLLTKKPRDQIQAQPHRVDVPRREFHAMQLADSNERCDAVAKGQRARGPMARSVEAATLCMFYARPGDHRPIVCAEL